jgi:hypothetical protein
VVEIERGAISALHINEHESRMSRGERERERGVLEISMMDKAKETESGTHPILHKEWM